MRQGEEKMHFVLGHILYTIFPEQLSLQKNLRLISHLQAPCNVFKEHLLSPLDWTTFLCLQLLLVVVE